MSVPSKNETEFHGYFPGVIGMITEAHAVYYHEHWGFDVSFETQVGRELSEFVAAFQKGRDGFWVTTVGDRFGGSVAIDGQPQFGLARQALQQLADNLLRDRDFGLAINLAPHRA